MDNSSKFQQLVNNPKRRQDHLVQLTEPNTGIDLKVLTHINDQDSTGWYGLGTTIDLTIPKQLDFATEILVFIDRLKEITTIVPPLIHLTTEYFSESNTYRFTDHFINLDPDFAIEAFRDAIQSKTAPEWREDLKETYNANYNKVRNLRRSVPHSKQYQEEMLILQSLSNETLGEIKTETDSTTAETAKTPESTETSTAKDRSSRPGYGFICNSKSNISIRLNQEPKHTKGTFSNRAPRSISPRSCYRMWTTAHKGKCGSSSIAKVPNPIGQ